MNAVCSRDDKLFIAVIGDALDKIAYRRQFLPQAIVPLWADLSSSARDHARPRGGHIPSVGPRP